MFYRRPFRGITHKTVKENAPVMPLTDSKQAWEYAVKAERGINERKKERQRKCSSNLIQNVGREICELLPIITYCREYSDEEQRDDIIKSTPANHAQTW